MTALIVEGLAKLKRDGEVSAKKVQETVAKTVSGSVQGMKNKGVSLRNLVKQATVTAIDELEGYEVATEDHIKAAGVGALDGITSAEKAAMDKTRQEICLLKTRIREEEENLATTLREALEGARESSEALTGEAKANVETAVTDVRTKSAELLGQTETTVKEAIRGILDKGTDVQERAIEVTKYATERGLAQARFSADRARKVSHSVISAAVQSAEEAGTSISEVAKAAVQGTGEGLAQTKEDLEAAENPFLEVVRKVGSRSKELVNDVANQAQETATALKKKADWAAA